MNYIWANCSTGSPGVDLVSPWFSTAEDERGDVASDSLCKSLWIFKFSASEGFLFEHRIKSNLAAIENTQITYALIEPPFTKSTTQPLRMYSLTLTIFLSTRKLYGKINARKSLCLIFFTWLRNAVIRGDKKKTKAKRREVLRNKITGK